MVKPKKIVVNAYAAVNNLSPEQVHEGAAMQRMQAATMQVASYPECFNGESEQDRDERLELRGPENGEFGDLAQHFKDLRPEFKGMSAYQIVFTMQNELDGRHEEAGDTETGASGRTDTSGVEAGFKGMNDVSPDKQRASSDYKNEIKEKNQMANKNDDANTVSDNILAKEEERMKELGEVALHGASSDEGTGTTTGSMPNDASIDKAASYKMFTANKEALIAMSENAKAVHVIFGRPQLEKILTGGKDAVGTIADPAATLATFKNTVGYKQNDDGTYTFEKVPAEWQNSATEVLNALIEAQTNTEKEFKISFSKGSPAIKGWEVQLPNEDAPKIMTIQEMKSFLLNSAALYIGIAGTSDMQVILRSITRNNTKSTGKATTDTKKDNKDALRGIASVAVSKRRDENHEDRLLGIALYHRAIDPTKQPEKKSGPKSDMFCKYKATKKTTNEEYLRTYRIPLQAEQYAVGVLDMKLKDVFGSSENGVGTLQPYNPTDARSFSKLMDSFADIVSKAAASSVEFAEGSMVQKVKAASDEVAKARAEADAADVEEGL